MDLKDKDKLFKGGVWAFGGKLFGVAIGVGVNGVLARLISPEEVGIYFLLFSLISFFVVASQLGMGQALIKFLAGAAEYKEKYSVNHAVFTSLKLVFVVIAFIAALLLFGGWELLKNRFLNSDLGDGAIYLVILWMSLFSLQSFFIEIFRSFHDIKFSILYGNLGSGIIAFSALVSIWLSSESSNINIVMFVMAISSAIIVFLSLIRVKKVIIRPNGNQSKKIKLSALLGVSAPIWVTSMVLYLLSQADMWVLAYFTPKSEVAIYGAAVKMTSLVVLPLMVANTILPPIIAEKYQTKDYHGLENILRLMATITGIPAILIILMFLGFGEYILDVVFGSFYVEAWSVLIILSLGQLFNVLAGSCGMVLMLTGRQMYLMWITVLSGMFSIIMAIILVGRYGVYGVAVSSLSGVVLQNIIMLYSVRKSLGIWPHFDLSRIMTIRNIV